MQHLSQKSDILIPESSFRKELHMKTALITGACINTGVAIVERFAAEGYNVVFTGRNAEKVHAKEAEYREKFPNVQIIGAISLPRLGHA